MRRVTMWVAAACVGALVAATPAAGTSNSLPSGERLVSLTALAADDVWAVGDSRDGNDLKPLVEHYDGSSWTIVETPDLGSRGRLTSVSAVSSDDVWAVGTSDLITGPDRIYFGRTLVEHWDGTSWSRVPSPNPNYNQNQLTAVHAIASDDVWAAGSRIYDDEEPPTRLTEHWDGSEWSWVRSGIDSGPDDRLVDVDASSGSDVWVVGSDPNTWAQRWTGDHFEEVEVPGRYALTGVAAITPTDTWVVGDTKTLHWDGTSWTSVRNAGFSPLRAISASSTADIWVVGGHQFQHWNGAHWRPVASPTGGFLLDVDARSPTDAWAVGGIHSHPLIEHWDGAAWTVVPAA